MLNYIPFHVHTVFSPLDGCLELKEYAQWAVDRGIPAISIADHGTLAGVFDFAKICKKKKLNPIVGGEFYIEVDDENIRHNAHLLLIAKDLEGYRNIVELNNRAVKENFYYKPRMRREWLLERKIPGVILTSGCMRGEVGSFVLANDPEGAEKTIQEYHEVYGDDFYLEIQFNELEQQHRANEFLLQKAKEYNIKLVLGCDAHYLDKDGAEVQERLIKIQKLSTGYNFDDLKGGDTLRFEARRLYLKEVPELFQEVREWGYNISMPEIMEAIKSTHEINEKCNFEMKTHIKYPNVPIEGDVRSSFMKICIAGLKEKYEKGVLDPSRHQFFMERINYEFEALNKMDYVYLYFIMRMIILEAKKQGVIVGPGRGSAAGSFTSFLFGNTYVDPIEHDLLFERFCNTSRASAPDIDVDFSDRELVLQIIRNMFGLDNTLTVANFSYYKPKSALRDLLRLEGVPQNEINTLTKQYDEKQSLLENMVTQPMKEGAVKYPDVFKYFKRIMKKIRHIGTHASAVIVLPENENLPIMKRRDVYCTQENGKTLESEGFLKLDILGLETLSIINHAIQVAGVADQVDIYNMNLTDQRVFDEYHKGNMVGIFQCENPETVKIFRSIKITNFNDLINVISVIRPNLDKEGFIRNHNNPHLMKLTPGLEEVLRPTFGVLLYQEQVMRICQDIGGFTLYEADLVRKAIAKKTDELTDYKQKFIDGAIHNAHHPEYAAKVWDMVEKCGDYIFNKSHACVYAYIGYICMYLKVYYPAAFVASCLRFKKEFKFVREANRLGIPVVFPDINKSEHMTNLIDGKIHVGLSACKGLENASLEIVAHRPYVSIKDFVNKVNLRKVASDVMEVLSRVGAFSEFNPNRKQAFYEVKRCVKQRRGQIRYTESERQGNLFPMEETKERSVDISTLSDYTDAEKRTDEIQFLGYSHIPHILQRHRHLIEATGRSVSKIEDVEGFKFMVAGQVIDIVHKKTKKDKPFWIVEVEDETGSINFFVWSDDLPDYSPLLSIGNTIVVKLERDAEFPTPHLAAREEAKMINLSDFLARKIR